MTSSSCPYPKPPAVPDYYAARGLMPSATLDELKHARDARALKHDPEMKPWNVEFDDENFYKVQSPFPGNPTGTYTGTQGLGANTHSRLTRLFDSSAMRRDGPNMTKPTPRYGFNGDNTSK
jgi:hypothetical protein